MPYEAFHIHSARVVTVCMLIFALMTRGSSLFGSIITCRRLQAFLHLLCCTSPVECPLCDQTCIGLAHAILVEPCRYHYCQLCPLLWWAIVIVIWSVGRLTWFTLLPLLPSHPEIHRTYPTGYMKSSIFHVVIVAVIMFWRFVLLWHRRALVIFVIAGYLVVFIFDVMVNILLAAWPLSRLLKL